MALSQTSSGASQTSSPDLVSVPLTSLRVGASLRAPIYDARTGRQHLLLAAGAVLTPNQLEVLRRRGVTTLLVHRHEYDRLCNTKANPRSTSSPAAPRAEAPANQTLPPAERGLPTGWKNDSDSFRNSTTPRAGTEIDPQIASRFLQQFKAAMETTQALFGDFAQDQRVDSNAVTGIGRRNIDQIGEDIDTFVATSLKPADDQYPSRHALQTTMLATSVGTIMGLRRDELLDLSFGCLIHDAGMLMVPAELRDARRPLTAVERLEIMKHPVYVSNVLNTRNDVSHGAKMIAYQMHERMNGTGYPRQRQGQQIHLYARIGAVADTYVALVSNRPQRPALTPYQAVERILFATRHGLFDPSVVRALLSTASLFPIGSVVTLSDGRLATVIRSNHEDYLRPVVQVSDPFAADRAGPLVNLLQDRDISIVSAGALGATES